MELYEYHKKELSKAFYEFSPYKDSRALTNKILKKESKGLKILLKTLFPIIRFIDERIIIQDTKITALSFYDDYGIEYAYIDGDFRIDSNPIKRDPYPREAKQTIKYYREDDKVMKGILISLNLKYESEYFEEDKQELGYFPPFPRISKVNGIEIYLLRSGKIIKFERGSYSDFAFSFDHQCYRRNPTKLSVEQFLKHDSLKRVINKVLRTYNNAIKENENKYPTLKKSLIEVLKIKKEFIKENKNKIKI